jgi:hypothetical protein
MMEMKELQTAVKLPNFLVIGAGKAGTTALYEMLDEHPQVYMSPVKETNFFALEGQDTGPRESDPEQMFHYPWSINNWVEYQSLFEAAGAEIARGEVSPMYLYSEKAALMIRDRLSDVKLIVILRQPVERLYSRYMHLCRENRQPSGEFCDALDRDSIWWRRNDLVQEGFYYQHLSRYFSLFDRKSIKVYLYEDLRKNKSQLISSLFEFIGVDPCFQPSEGIEPNVSGIIQNKLADKLIGQNSILKEVLANSSPGLWQKVKSNPEIRKWVNKLRKHNLHRPALDLDLRRQMTQEIYKKDILNLQNLIKRDLSHWL